MRHVQRSHDVRVRSYQFSVDTIAFCRSGGVRDPLLQLVALQLVDAAGSVGANLEEAAAGQSKAACIAKNCIALKEARQGRFWLRLIAASAPSLATAVRPLIAESSALIAMLVAGIKTARTNTVPDRKA